MNAESDKIYAPFIDQLSNIDRQPADKMTEGRRIAEIHAGIEKSLGDNPENEDQIRRIVQDRYDRGDLHRETFELVQSMLDSYVTELLATSPTSILRATATSAGEVADASFDAPPDEDPFTTTTVIETSTDLRAETADARVQVGSVLRDRFMLQERVSGGSMGVVYKALDRRLAEAGAGEPWVAVKILSPQLARNSYALRALQQEAAKGRCLAHPNIVRFIDLDRDDDLYFLVMEWLDGRTLADILDSPDAATIDKAKAFRIVRQIGNALEYAHRCGIIHADVKPANIMMMPNGDAKLFDFGVARVRQVQLSREPNFDPGVLGLLTPAYSSMQVLTGEGPVPADDVFSLACLLYRLLAGYRVFGPRNAAEAAEEGMSPQRLEGLTDDQWRALKRALSYARVTRFASMQEFIDALNVADSKDNFRVEMPRTVDMDEPRGIGLTLFGAIVAIALLGFGAYQYGYLDDTIAKLAVLTESRPPAEQLPGMPEQADEQILELVPAVVEPVEPDVADAEAEAGVNDPLELTAERAEVFEPNPILEPLVDFSNLPPATAEVQLARRGAAPETVTVTLREDADPVTIDVLRADASMPLTLRLEEISYSGNRSPFISGQYTFSDNGFLEFPSGQDRVRVTLSMNSDPLREADQQSTLRIREADSVESELARITVFLEDDDQRYLEARLPVNTIAFAVSQTTVRESDPAVQVDIQRFNPDDTPMMVAYVLHDVTAVEGEDYFAPSGNVISFGPGQRLARLLIPLVQDSLFEGDEAFVLELSNSDSAADTSVFRRIAVMIRDDDLAPP